MSVDDKKRLSRLYSIYTYLQVNSVVTAKRLSKEFEVSTRTIYRDIRALEDAGVPIYLDGNKGYKLVDGFKTLPLMLSEAEANVLIAVKHLIFKSSDKSIIDIYTNVVKKIELALAPDQRKKIQLLSDRMMLKNVIGSSSTSNYLSDIQSALTNFKLIKIRYCDQRNQITERVVEPFAIVSSADAWWMIAFCQLRDDFRYFRLDRIVGFELLELSFSAHNITLEELFEQTKSR
ncbi:MAG: YafY family transcriptional regulator [Natronospirillum sp.]